MSIDWELPPYDDGYDSGTSIRDTGSDIFSGDWDGGKGDTGFSRDFSGDDDSFDFGSGDWFVDSSSSSSGEDASMLGDVAGGVWDWLKTPQGTNVAGGVIQGLMGMYGANLADKMRGGQQGDEGPNAAELYDARVKTHNASINAPVNTNLINFKRP